ncbi:hypothetical protein [Aeromonas phage 44RR2.8t.2]|uniref:Uncharacterized protein n=1 Tax=Aeromonas phage 44RR2.8t.2 TaxID=1932900 RepID=A0A219Y9T5_9CAUD|nr:hypothetical protein [Aeromonas phage 44RR2.8t.2]
MFTQLTAAEFSHNFLVPLPVDQLSVWNLRKLRFANRKMRRANISINKPKNMVRAITRVVVIRLPSGDEMLSCGNVWPWHIVVMVSRNRRVPAGHQHVNPRIKDYVVILPLFRQICDEATRDRAAMHDRKSKVAIEKHRFIFDVVI